MTCGDFSDGSLRATALPSTFPWSRERKFPYEEICHLNSLFVERDESEVLKTCALRTRIGSVVSQIFKRARGYALECL